MAQGASRAPFWGPKNQGPLEKGRFAARTHFEAYNSPHFVIWERRFYKTTPGLQHRSLNSYNSRYFPSPSINVKNNLHESHATVPLKLFQHEKLKLPKTVQTNRKRGGPRQNKVIICKVQTINSHLMHVTA